MSLTALAQEILTAAKTLDRYIADHNLPQPSTLPTGPPFFRVSNDPSACTALATLLESTHKLTHLAQGPATIWLGTLNSAAGDGLATALIQKFDIPTHIPLDHPPEGVPFGAVAQKCGMDERDFALVVRYAMTSFVFCEPTPGHIAHTASSAVLKQNGLVRALAGMGVEEVWPSLACEAEVMKRAGEGGKGRGTASESAWALANKTTTPLFAHLETHAPERATSMAFAMESLAKMAPASTTVSHPPWSALPPNALIIDVGGGKGYACRALASAFPGFRFIVQDLPDTVAAAEAQWPTELAGRARFQVQDFFTPQPAAQVWDEGKKEQADVFFMRAIMHDWPDDACVSIIKNLIPGLKRGARVVIYDPHTPDPKEVGWWQDRQARGSNLRMKVLFNGHDRERGEWAGLFARADPRFSTRVLEVFDRDPGNIVGQLMVVVEAVWEW